MKVTKIETEEGVYKVTLSPNFIERIFFVKQRTVLVKPTGRTYSISGGKVYVDHEGDILGSFSYIGNEIDRWERRF